MRNLSASELAAEAGIDVAFLLDIENGERDCNIRTIVKIAIALELPPSVLLDLVEDVD